MNLRALASALVCLFVSVLMCSCPSRSLSPYRQASPKGAQSSSAPGEAQTEPKGPDPRAAFESSGILGGLSARLESSVSLLPGIGMPEAGSCLALGANLSEAAIVRRLPLSGSKGFDHELVLASGARASLPGPAIALAATGERFVVASSLGKGGALLGFKAEGEGERLLESWKKEGPAVRRLLAVPGGRIAAADDEGQSPRLYLIDAATGSELWGLALSAAAADIAYAPGIVLAVAGSQLSAYDESTGAQLWIASLPAKARSLAAGNGVALVLAEVGSLSAFSLADGKGLGAAPGPFDSSLRPISDLSHAIVALPGGGAEELEVKTGHSVRRWSWMGQASFIAADRDRIYAGVSGSEGAAVFIGSRAGESSERSVSLAERAFDAPIAVSGSRGGLLLLLQDSSLILVGKELESGVGASALDAAVSPSPEIAVAIGSALGRFKTADGIAPGRYLRFDLFTQGIPVDQGASFTAYRYDAVSSAKRVFAAKPEATGEVVAIFDESGHEIAASIDELGSVSKAMAYLERGRRYWAVAGWTYQAEPTSFRLYVK